MTDAKQKPNVLAGSETGKNDHHSNEMINALPAAIYTTDAKGRLMHFNPAAVEFSGREPELGTDHWCNLEALLRRCRMSSVPMAVALKEGCSINGEEAIADRPDGKRIWFEAMVVK